ncbi:hypothetical protein ACFXKG_38610 [Streptomyces sp. NPDC059255]|uniref:hypothetical protein n=1 Tax=Streptomyces sp. NPDC059255 TaxID=3346793 RepID=UPI0036AFA748
MRTTSAYEQLLSRLSGGDRDFWDRPDGSWGEHEREEALGDAEAERRADANSAYVIGSRALRRDELDNARAWFAVAADAEHPGAAFRSALTAARSTAQENISACYNLLRAAPERREAEVRRWLRVAADWGHGDARHLIGTLSESGESTGCATGLGADGDGGDGETPASGRPVRVEDTEFYDELHTFLFFPGHGERPEPGQEPETEPARPGEVSGAKNAGECSVVLMEHAGAVPDRSAAPLLHASRIRRFLDERSLFFVLVAACGEGVPAASGWPGERVRERLALAAWRPVAWQQVARRWGTGWSGLRTELPPAVVTSPATSLRMAEVELPGGDVVGGFRLLLDRVMRLTAADGAHTFRQRHTGTPEADRLPDSVLRADGELQGAATRAPLVWLVLNSDRSAVETVGASRLPSTVTIPSSLRSCMQDSAPLDALDRFRDIDLWQECAQWLPSACSGPPRGSGTPRRRRPCERRCVCGASTSVPVNRLGGWCWPTSADRNQTLPWTRDAMLTTAAHRRRTAGARRTALTGGFRRPGRGRTSRRRGPEVDGATGVRATPEAAGLGGGRLVRAGPLRTGPLAGELTSSLIGRVAGRYGMERSEVLAQWSLTESPTRHPGGGGVRADGEVVLNKAGRRVLAELCGVESRVLARALPAYVVAGVAEDAVARGRWRAAQTVAGPAVFGCRSCAALRTGQAVSSVLYRPRWQQVRVRHGKWLLDADADPAWEHLDLGLVSEVVQTQYRWAGVRRRAPRGWLSASPCRRPDGPGCGSPPRTACGSPPSGPSCVGTGPPGRCPIRPPCG